MLESEDKVKPHSASVHLDNMSDSKMSSLTTKTRNILKIES
jgi:hypothetical protein